MLAVSGYAQSQTMSNSFTHFTELDGLPASDVKEIIQDHLGYIWIATINGLSRYDGYGFKNFSAVKDDPNFLQLPLLTTLFEDSLGELWIGAVGGLTKYDRSKKTFKLYSLGKYESEEDRTFFVSDIVETPDHDILFTVCDFNYFDFKYGLYVLKKDSSQIEKYFDVETNMLFAISPIGNNQYYISGYNGFGKLDYRSSKLEWFPFTKETGVLTFVSENKNEVWLGTYNQGIIRYNTTDSSYKTFPIVELSGRDDNTAFIVTKIINDQNDNLLITSNSGLFQFNTKTNDTKVAEIDPLNPLAMNTINLNSIMQDNSGSFWISSTSGISKYDITKSNFHSYKHNPNNPNGIEAGWVTFLFEHNKNEVWFQSDPGSISVLYRDKNETKNYKIPTGFRINSVMRDSNNKIWSIGDKGLNMLDPQNWKFEKVDMPSEFIHNSFFMLFEDSEGIIWIGTTAGVFTLDASTYSYAKIDFQSLGLGNSTSNLVHRIVEDKNKNIWFGTDNGLFKYSIKNGQYTRIGNSADPEKSLNSQDVNSLYIDNDGKVWVGTWLGGLNSYDPVTQKFESFTQKEGLKSYTVQGILGDEKNGAIWLSTFDGISRFDLKERTFSNFGLEDGVHGNQFTDGVALKTSDGNFIFGGQGGLTLFKPEEIKSNIVPPKILLTDFKLFNEILKPSENSPLKLPIYVTRDIVLDYDENDISIDYLAVHYVNPQKNQYAYRLLNYNDEWRYVGSQRTAIYPNLPPGKYTFQVKAANNNNVWNEEPRSLSIIINTPPWATWWAYFLYAFFAFGFLYLVRNVELKRQQKNAELKENKLRAEAAELQARAIQAENDRKTKELEEARQLQLSMLPKELPKLPNLNIAVYMKTATEVGGDYYDFNLGLEGILTIVLGDATGHGLKAGTMVTSVKSLFNSYANNHDIAATFNEMTKCIKKMQFDKLFMSFTMLKIKDKNLTMSAGGMPPVYIYSASDKSVKEFEFKGMPLGTIEKFPYQLEDFGLNVGDTILLTSDGLPELQNKKNEQYGYKRLRNKFEEYGNHEPEKIIELLNDDGNNWLNGKEADDDITFVVIKVK